MTRSQPTSSSDTERQHDDGHVECVATVLQTRNTCDGSSRVAPCRLFAWSFDLAHVKCTKMEHWDTHALSTIAVAWPGLVQWQTFHLRPPSIARTDPFSKFYACMQSCFAFTSKQRTQGKPRTAALLWQRYPFARLPSSTKSLLETCRILSEELTKTNRTMRVSRFAPCAASTSRSKGCVHVVMASDVPPTSLERSVRLAQKRLGSELSRLGEAGVDERIASASRTPPPRASFVSAVERRTFGGQCAIVAEVSAGSPSAPAWHAVEAAEQCVEGGADAIALRTDLESNADGLLQLQLVCRAMEARNIPVLQLDWIMHPLQVAQAKEAGAAGVQIVASVLGDGTPATHDAILQLGMEPIVEVINQKDLDIAEKCNARLFGVHLSVALALPNAEARNLATKGLLQSLPFGALSWIGVASMDEARKAIAYGADALLLKRDMLVLGSQSVTEILQEVRYLASGDD